MRKYAFVWLLFCLTAGTALAQHTDMKTYLGDKSEQEWMAGRKLKPANIGPNLFYWCGSTRIVRYTGPDGDPSKIGPIFYENELHGGTRSSGRRFPRTNYREGDVDEYLLLNDHVRFIRTGPDQTVEILVDHEVDLAKWFANCRLLIIPPNTEVEFHPPKDSEQNFYTPIPNALGNLFTSPCMKHPLTCRDVIGDKHGFIIRKGSLKEDTDFKNASKFDEVMSMYSCVPEKLVKAWVESIRTLNKQASNDDLADKVIFHAKNNSGAFGALAAAAPLWAIPAQFGVDFVKNIGHAYLAYAIAYVYNTKFGPDEFKNDLYVLFADKRDIKKTLREMAPAIREAVANGDRIGYQSVETDPVEIALDFLTNEEVLSKVGGSKAFEAVLKNSTIMKKVSEKFTAKDVAKVGKVLTIFREGIMDANETGDFGEQAKIFYRHRSHKKQPPAPAPKKTYTVTFMADYGQPLTVITADSNATVTFPKDPTKTGYFLREWNTDKNGRGASFNLNNRVTANLTLYPQWAEKTAPAKPNVAYSPGETGPGGGIVFIQGSPAFECSAADLGSGPESYADALTLAKNYRGGGKSDWRLPTKDELNKMYTALHRNKKGNFKNVSYWATNGSSPFAQDFGTSGTNASPNENKRLVRAVRSF